MVQDAFPQNPQKTALDTADSLSPRLLSKKSRRWAAHIPWYCEAFNPARGESGLWKAVITQALMDALGRSCNPERQSQKHAAIQWLTGNSNDFQFVCGLAGMNPDEVRRRAKKALVSPVQWRAEAGAGARYHERKKYREKHKKKDPALAPSLPPRGGETKIIVGPWQ